MFLVVVSNESAVATVGYIYAEFALSPGIIAHSMFMNGDRGTKLNKHNGQISI